MTDFGSIHLCKTLSTLPFQMLGVIHHCIPYCKPEHGEHTELMYGTDDETEATLQRVVLYWRSAKLIRFAEEPNAPAKMDTNGMKPYPKAWLVTWQRDHDDAN